MHSVFCEFITQTHSGSEPMGSIPAQCKWDNKKREPTRIMLLLCLPTVFGGSADGGEVEGGAVSRQGGGRGGPWALVTP